MGKLNANTIHTFFYLGNFTKEFVTVYCSVNRLFPQFFDLFFKN